MFNTTTIPTQMETNNTFFCLFGLLSLSMLLGYSMMEGFLYREKKYYGYSHSEDEDEDEDETEESYTDRYYKEFEALALRELSDIELLCLNTKLVREQVAENVEVLLTFDKATETFWYYTDHLKEVSYDILETVARKFAIEYDCKKICLLAQAQAPESVEAPKEQESTGKPSVFAKFKNYNTGGKGSTPNFTSVIKVVEQMNHFRYRGKIVDYEETQKGVNKTEEPTLDYASYKTLFQKKRKLKPCPIIAMNTADGGKKKEDKKEDKKNDEKKEGTDGEKKEGEEGKKEGKGSDKDEKGKCVGEESCAGKDIAAKFSSPGKMLDNAKENMDKKIKEGMKTVVTTITNPAKCATMAVGAVPAMINGIGKSISGAFDGITLSINNSFKAADAKGFTGILGPFKIANAMFLGKLQGIINNIALGPDADKILSDPKLTAKLLFDKLVFRSNLYKMAIKDAEFRGVFKVWMSDYVNTLLASLKVAQPEIDRINKEVKTIIEGMGSNVGESLGHAIVNVIASALGALPVVGGVVSAIKGADQLGQEIINACKPPIAKGAGIVMPAVNQFNKQKSRLNCEVEKLEGKVKPIIQKIEGKMSKITSKVGGGMQSGGGGMQGRNTKKRINKKIANTTKRINELLSRFTVRRRNSKPNYTRRLNQSRC